jgi:hypothetical protein
MLPHAFLGRSIFRLFRSLAGLPTKVDAQIQLSTNEEAIASGRMPHFPQPCDWGLVFWCAAHPLSTDFVVELIGIEPTTSGLQSPRSPS